MAQEKKTEKLHWEIDVRKPKAAIVAGLNCSLIGADSFA
jgi:hypothetical protein